MWYLYSPFSGGVALWVQTGSRGDQFSTITMGCGVPGGGLERLRFQRRLQLSETFSVYYFFLLKYEASLEWLSCRGVQS